VTISTSTTGDSIRYTTDGSTPSSTVGTLYSGPILVSSSKTIKAIGYMTGSTNSAVGSASYTINTSSLQAPSNPLPTNGATAVATSVTLQCNAVAGVMMYQYYLGTSSTPSLSATLTDLGNCYKVFASKSGTCNEILLEGYSNQWKYFSQQSRLVVHDEMISPVRLTRAEHRARWESKPAQAAVAGGG